MVMSPGERVEVFGGDGEVEVESEQRLTCTAGGESPRDRRGLAWWA